jgi:hypothetical protein
VRRERNNLGRVKERERGESVLERKRREDK